jgi:hypothetical protein
MTTEPNAFITAEEPQRKKRGGQPGNTNAIKHGFYAKNFSLDERRGLQVTKSVVLGDEIALLRVLIRHFAEQIQASQGVGLTESAQAEADTIRLSAVPYTLVDGQHLAVISEAMLRLGWNEVEPLEQSEGGILLRTDHMLGGSHSKSALRAKRHPL